MLQFKFEYISVAENYSESRIEVIFTNSFCFNCIQIKLHLDKNIHI